MRKPWPSLQHPRLVSRLCSPSYPHPIPASQAVDIGLISLAALGEVAALVEESHQKVESLNQSVARLDTVDAEISALKQEVAALKQKLETLEHVRQEQVPLLFSEVFRGVMIFCLKVLPAHVTRAPAVLCHVGCVSRLLRPGRW